MTTEGDALREMARLYRSAVVELLMREYRWSGGAAERFAAALDIEATAAAERARAARRDIRTRRERTHESEEAGPQTGDAGADTAA